MAKKSKVQQEVKLTREQILAEIAKAVSNGSMTPEHAAQLVSSL